MSGYEALWGSGLLSDVEVLLVEDASEPGTKRKQEVSISSHKVVLACNSEYLKAQVRLQVLPGVSAAGSLCTVQIGALLHGNAACVLVRVINELTEVFRACLCLLQFVNWTQVAESSSSDTSSKQQVSIPVAPGQLELGQLLLKCMYQDTPDLSTASQQELLELLVLADKYVVPKVTTAICSRFRGLFSANLEWETAMKIFQLPESIRLSKQYTAVVSLAAAKLQQDLGDLDAAWSDDNKQQLLLQLPLCALHQLLLSDQTRVASEDTAAYTVARVVNEHVQAAFPDGTRWGAPSSSNLNLPDAEHAAAAHPFRTHIQQLVGAVRMVHCSQAYIATVLSIDPNISSVLSPYELQIAALCSVDQGVPSNSIVLKKYPGWCARKRPASAVKKLSMEWHVPLGEVRGLFEQCTSGEQASNFLTGPAGFWQGHMVRPSIRLFSKSTEETASESAKGKYIGMHMMLEGGEHALAKAFLQASLVSAQLEPRRQHIMGKMTTFLRGDRDKFVGCTMSFGSGTWLAVFNVLHGMNLVHPGGRLHFNVEVAHPPN